MLDERVQCPECGSKGWFYWTGVVTGVIETEDGMLEYPVVDSYAIDNRDYLECQECEYEGTVGEFKDAAK